MFGAETDVQWSDAEDTVAPVKFANTWFGTLRGRVGYAMNNVLAYGTGGFAYGGVELSSDGVSQSQTHYGWTLGVGAEVGLTPNWTAKVEYLYFDLTNRHLLHRDLAWPGIQPAARRRELQILNSEGAGGEGLAAARPFFFSAVVFASRRYSIISTRDPIKIRPLPGINQSF